jgi:hypothetical protein
VSEEAYYVVINDNPLPHISHPFITGPGDNLGFYTNKEAALDRRDEIRAEYENLDINVYRMTLHKGPIKRDAEVAQ